MLATIIMDAYRVDEAREIADALKDVCSPSITYGFASAALYCFWDLGTREILYIGLASDVVSRFKQHNGLVKFNAGGCKREQIAAHLDANDRIGYSIMVQSSLDQQITQSDKKALRKIGGDDYMELVREVPQGKKNVDFGEGFFIDAHRRRHGLIPKWNKQQGIEEAQGSPWPNTWAPMLEMTRMLAAGTGEEEALDEIRSRQPYHFLDYLCGAVLSDYHAKCTLRELAADATALANEEFMHAIRHSMIFSNIGFEAALNKLLLHDRFGANRLESMKKADYLDRVPNLVANPRTRDLPRS